MDLGGRGLRGQHDDFISQRRPTQRSGSSTHSCLRASSPTRAWVKDGRSIGAHTALMTSLCW